MNFKERINPTTTTKVMNSHIPRIGITSEALAKMFIYVDECSDEIGWLGTVETLDARHYIINDVFLFEQDVHGTTTEITPEGLASFAEELMQQPDGLEIWNNMKMWGHSHVRMGVTPSGQDDKQMKEFAEGGHDWFIRLICNKNGDMKLDFFNYATGIYYLDVHWEIIESDSERAIQDEITRIEKEVEAQLKALKETLEQSRKLLQEEYKEPIKEEMKDKVRKMRYSYGSSGTSYVTKQYPHPYGLNEYANEYGYRMNGKWNLYTEEEKKMLLPSNGTKSNQRTMTLGGLDTGSKKKVDDKNVKKEETESVIRSIGRYLEENYFETDDQVVETFSQYELQILASFATLEEVEEELEIYGWYNMFTEDDLERIYRVAFKFQL